MSEYVAYRANDELTKAWREHREARQRHIDTVVKPWTDAHPDNDPLYRRGDVCGFRDGAPNDPPPTGLSRAKTRPHLIPVRGKAGDEWREAMSALSLPVSDRQLLHRFGFRDQMYSRDGQTYVGFPSAIDFDEDGVWVYANCEIENLPECVTPAKRSEFYAAQERAVERQERSGVSS